MNGFLFSTLRDKIRSFDDTAKAAEFFGMSEAAITDWLRGVDIPISAYEKAVLDQIKTEDARQESKRWEGRQVCVVFPWYKTSSPKTVFSLMSLLDRTRMAVMLDYGDAFIAHSRNKLADQFLKTGLEWMLTVDDDMILPFGNSALFKSFTGFKCADKFAGMNTVDRLLSHGKTLVGALYMGRWTHGRPVYAEANQKAEEEWARKGPHDVVKPTQWVGTGCMLIHRTVFLDIEKKFPILARGSGGTGGQWFTSSEHDLKQSAVECLSILRDSTVPETVRVAEVLSKLEQGMHYSSRNSGLGVGEDVIFCRRAGQSGHQPHVDCGLRCGHIGEFVY